MLLLLLLLHPVLCAAITLLPSFTVFYVMRVTRNARINSRELYILPCVLCNFQLPYLVYYRSSLLCKKSRLGLFVVWSDDGAENNSN